MKTKAFFGVALISSVLLSNSSFANTAAIAATAERPVVEGIFQVAMDPTIVTGEQVLAKLGTELVVDRAGAEVALSLAATLRGVHALSGQSGPAIAWESLETAVLASLKEGLEATAAINSLEAAITSGARSPQQITDVLNGTMTIANSLQTDVAKIDGAEFHKSYEPQTEAGIALQTETLDTAEAHQLGKLLYTAKLNGTAACGHICGQRALEATERLYKVYGSTLNAEFVGDSTYSFKNNPEAAAAAPATEYNRGLLNFSIRRANGEKSPQMEKLEVCATKYNNAA